MKRNAIEKLIDWKQGEPRTPLFLSGVRGCGKTYLAMDFAKSFFEGALYLNFEQKNAQSEALLAEIRKEQTKRGGALEAFPAGFSLAAFSERICTLFDVPLEYRRNFLIVLDEVCGDGVLWDLLVSRAGETLDFCVLVISSQMPALPAQSLHLNLYPFTFEEFLFATGQEWYSEVIRGHFQTNHRIPGIVHEELVDQFDDYLCTGGMPAAINEYLCFEAVDNLPEIHQRYFGHVLYRIQKHHAEGEALKMRQILEVIPAQLEKENQKFQYRMIRKGATGALYQNAIQALCKEQLIWLCRRQDKEEAFKIFPADIGFLYAVTGKGILGKEQDRGFRRLLLGCYVMQALSACGYPAEFWESLSQARVDFLIGQEGVWIPIEVKTTENARSKSIGVYRASHEVPYSIKISYHNFDFSGGVRSIPYYAIFCL